MTGPRCPRPRWVLPARYETPVAEDGPIVTPSDVRVIPSVPTRLLEGNYNEMDEGDALAVRRLRRRIVECREIDPPVLTVYHPPLDPDAPAGQRVYFNGAHRVEAAARAGLRTVPLAVVFADGKTEEPVLPPGDWRERAEALLREIRRDSEEYIAKIHRENEEYADRLKDEIRGAVRR